MGAERRQKKATEAELKSVAEQSQLADDDDRKILAAVTALPGYPWSAIRELSGLKNGGRDHAARSRLVSRGLIELRQYSHEARPGVYYWPAGHPGLK